MGSQASLGSNLVILRAFLIGLPKGVMNLGVENRDLLGVFTVRAVPVVPPGWSPAERSGDRDMDGEWICDGGQDIGGLGVAAAGLGVIGAELTSSTSAISFVFLAPRPFHLQVQCFFPLGTLPFPLGVELYI